MELSDKIVLGLITLSVIIVVAATSYRFLYARDYAFTVEAACDGESSICFYRDCSVESDCPVNNLENYKIYSISAKDFSNCSDNSCAKECSDGSIVCEETICSVEGGDDCTTGEDGEINDESTESVLQEQTTFDDLSKNSNASGLQSEEIGETP